MRSERRVLFLLGLSVLTLSLPSCSRGGGRKPTYPVTGKVVDGNRPIANASVVLHPISQTGPDVVKPRGKTDADGVFKLTTYDGDDGAPAGEYRATVELWLTSRADEGPTNRLPAKLAKPETSGLTATVGAGPTELKPFALKK